MPNDDNISPKPLTGRRAATLDEFFDAVRSASPFFSSRVNELSGRYVDVPGIRSREYRELCQLAESCLDNHSSAGVMLMGGAGVGKSHLLVRLSRWADERGAVYCFLHNVVASPDHMPQQVLRYVVSLLIRSSDNFRESVLYGLMKAVAKESLRQASLNFRNVTSQQLESAFECFLGKLPIRNDLADRKIGEVLLNFFRIANTNPAVFGSQRQSILTLADWLSGDAVSAEALQEAGVDPTGMHRNDDGFVQLAAGNQIKQVIFLLTELAAAVGKPFVICVDQIDNLEREQVSSLSRFLHALVDARNLLVVTSGVQQTMLDFRETGVIAEAAWDRLAGKEMILERIDPGQARDILMARLNDFLTPFRHLPEIAERREKHAFFPLAEKEFEERFGDALEVRPRDVIRWARDAWQQEQRELEKLDGRKWLNVWGTQMDPDPRPEPAGTRDELIDQTVQAEIRKRVASLQSQKGSLPPDANNLTTLIHDLLKHCLNRPSDYSLRNLKRIDGNRPSYHLHIDEAEEKTGTLVTNGVCFVTSSDGRTTTPALNRFLKTEDRLTRRILVTDEERAPLPLPPGGKKRYDQLVALGNGFRHIKLDLKLYAELDAYNSVIGQARGGDLEITVPSGESATVSEDAAIASLHRLDVFRTHPVLGEFTCEPNSVAPLPLVTPPNLEESQIRSCISGHLAINISMTTSELTEVLLANLQSNADFGDAHKQVIEVSEKMAAEQRVYAKDNGGMLHLILV